jgi:hypothetical protein
LRTFQEFWLAERCHRGERAGWSPALNNVVKRQGEEIHNNNHHQSHRAHQSHPSITSHTVNQSHRSSLVTLVLVLFISRQTTQQHPSFFARSLQCIVFHFEIYGQIAPPTKFYNKLVISSVCVAVVKLKYSTILFFATKERFDFSSTTTTTTTTNKEREKRKINRQKIITTRYEQTVSHECFES